MNYHDHCKEIGSSIPQEPIWFDKPASSLLLPGENLKWYSSYKKIEYEIELGVIIRKGGKDIQEERSMDHVDSYFLGIDFTDRAF